MMASNDDHVVQLETDDRRYLVLEVSPEILQLPKSEQIAYFEAIWKQMGEGGYENLLHRLMTRDITNFVVWDYPRNAAIKRQMLLSADTMVQWLLQRLDDQCMTLFNVGSKQGEPRRWTDPIAVQEIRLGYIDYAHLRQMDRRDTTKLGAFLHKLFPNLKKEMRKVTYMSEARSVTSGLTYCYLFPSLDECRAAFESEYGQYDWSPIGEAPALALGDSPVAEEKDVF